MTLKRRAHVQDTKRQTRPIASLSLSRLDFDTSRAPSLHSSLSGVQGVTVLSWNNANAFGLTAQPAFAIFEPAEG